MKYEMNLEICPENMSYELTSRDRLQHPSFGDSDHLAYMDSHTTPRCHPIHIYKKSYISLRTGSSIWYISNKKLVAA